MTIAIYCQLSRQGVHSSKLQKHDFFKDSGEITELHSETRCYYVILTESSKFLYSGSVWCPLTPIYSPTGRRSLHRWVRRTMKRARRTTRTVHRSWKTAGWRRPRSHRRRNRRPLWRVAGSCSGARPSPPAAPTSPASPRKPVTSSGGKNERSIESIRKRYFGSSQIVTHRRRT